VLVAVGVLAVRGRSTAGSAAHRVWLFSIGLLASLLVARVTWEYMTVLAIPCFVLWLQHLLQEGAQRSSATRWHWTVFVISWVLCAAPFPYSKEPLRDGLGLLLMSPRLYGLSLAFIATLSMQFGQQRIERS
jgi:hypothetical protein